MTQHAGLDADRWSEFDLDQQILMIGNEMNRSVRLARLGQIEGVRRGYERVLRLTGLTVACGLRPGLLRELLRWRGLVAEEYLAGSANPAWHGALLRSLLQLRPVAALQIRLLEGAVRMEGPSI
ncbi:MAG: hypothetical protein ABIF09_00445 [Gemmatimonadota bacterium]